MSVDLDAAQAFMAGHARILDRRRFQQDAEAMLAALDAYANPDGGYGWGLEPDLRSPESQPAGALHAFEVLAEAPSPERAATLCEWLAGATLPDGGLPFALPVTDPAAVAPFWAAADATKPSLQITAYVAAAARRAGVAADDAWLARATEHCLAAIDALEDQPHALVVNASLQLLDSLADEARIERLGRHIGAGGTLHVAGGQEDEMMRPLDFAPWPDRPVRGLFSEDVIERELGRLESEQQPDGGWRVDFASYSPAAELEWRGYMTVRAVAILRANDRLAD